MSDLLEVEDLVIDIRSRRGVIRAVDGVSFRVPRGQAFGLVGESGCGKSTTLRAVLGLLPRGAEVVRGHIRFDGVDLLDRRNGALDRVRGRGISMVFQEPMTALNPLVRAGRQIQEAARIGRGLDAPSARAAAVEWMGRVGIPDAERRARAYPYELSGGMRQRVMIAMALASGPRLLLCDEPTTALDVTVQDQILGILGSLQETEGLTTVYVSHDLAVVSQICDRLGVIYAGRLVETGTVAAVFAQPRHPYTLGLLRAAPRFELARGPLVPIPGAPPDPLSPPSGCRFHPRCGFATDECRQGEFPLLAPEADHATACIHSQRCAQSLREDRVLADD